MKLGVLLGCGLALTVPGASARAEGEAQRALFVDSAAVVSVRPSALAKLLPRLGSGWVDLARRELRLPPAVNPLDPAVLAITGIDPEAASVIAARPLRGGIHVRCALALSSSRVAEALVRTAASVLGAEITSGPLVGMWQGRMSMGLPLLMRLSGTTLIVDWVLPGPTASPTAADLARVIPLRPPRPWSRGQDSARRSRGEDAVFVFIDLHPASMLSLVVSERAGAAAARAADPSQKSSIQRAARDELLTCKHRLDEPSLFDDVALSLSSHRDDAVALSVTFGGKRAAMSGLRVSDNDVAPQPTGDPDVQVRMRGPVAIASAVTPSATVAQEPRTCAPFGRAGWWLRAWPRALAGVRSLPILQAVRAGAVVLPRRDRSSSFSATDWLGLFEVVPAQRDSVESALARGDAPFLTLVDDRGPSLVIGDKEPANKAFDTAPTPLIPPGAIATFSAGGHGMVRLLSLAPNALVTLDRVEQLDASLAVDGELLRLEASFRVVPMRAR